MRPLSKHRRLAGILAVAVWTPACMAWPQASSPAALDITCTTVPTASAPTTGTGGQQPQWDLPSVPGSLGDGAARSPGSALAVGWTFPHQRPLVALWTGAAWKTLSNPALPVVGALTGVALFPGGAWAVGERGMAENGRVSFPLMMRVTGTRMREVPIPRTTYGGVLNEVAAVSAADAWAVGAEAAAGGGSGPALISHWNGTAWTRVQLPAAVARDVAVADGVAATSRTNVWLAGAGFARQPRIVHWNGRRWGDVAGPLIGTRYDLVGVAATSATNVWAAGNTASRAVILHWNGRRWTCALSSKMPAPNLVAVSASSADDAWVVGGSSGRAVALHWNGHAWTQVMTPQPGGDNFLQDVAVIPQSASAWAVGTTDGRTLMLHWNGAAWQ